MTAISMEFSVDDDEFTADPPITAAGLPRLCSDPKGFRRHAFIGQIAASHNVCSRKPECSSRLLFWSDHGAWHFQSSWKCYRNNLPPVNEDRSCQAEKSK